jgi:DNA-binding winged helix-turn-helix (wHTH) protein
MLRGMACLVIGLVPGMFEVPELVEWASARVKDLVVAEDLPIVVCIGRSERGLHDTLAVFIDNLAQGGITAALVTRGQAERLLGGMRRRADRRRWTVPVILPGGPTTDDEYAIALAADRGCSAVFWTPDDCVMTADSSRVSDAELREHVNFDEMMEVGALGRSVVGAGAAQLAQSTNTDFRIHSIETGRWTSVTHDTYANSMNPIASIGSQHGIALIEATSDRDVEAAQPAVPYLALLDLLAHRDLPIDQLQLLPNGVRFTCEAAHCAVVAESAEKSGLAARVIEGCTRLVVVGAGMSKSSGALYAMLGALHHAGIEPLHVTDSSVTVSLLVSQADAARAETLLHAVFKPSERVTASKKLAFDVRTRVLNVHGRSEKLGKRQARLLNLFLQNVGRVIEVEQAADHIFEDRSPQSISALRVHVHNLRKKIEDDPENPRYILTVPNRGYTFARPWSSSTEGPD